MKYHYSTAPGLFYKNQLNERSDVWSFGVILYLLLYKKYPWAGNNIAEYF